MIKWIKTLLQTIRKHDSEIGWLRLELATLRQRVDFAEKLVRDRTDISVDLGFQRDNYVIVTGRYKGADYVQTFHVPADDLGEFIDRLKMMERFGKVRRIDAPPSIRAVVKHDLR